MTAGRPVSDGGGHLLRRRVVVESTPSLIGADSSCRVARTTRPRTLSTIHALYARRSQDRPKPLRLRDASYPCSGGTSSRAVLYMYAIFIICDRRKSNNKHKKQSQNDVQCKAASAQSYSCCTNWDGAPNSVIDTLYTTACVRRRETATRLSSACFRQIFRVNKVRVIKLDLCEHSVDRIGFIRQSRISHRPNTGNQ